MMYSQWNPTNGRYDYYETPVVHGINDDLPKPHMPRATSPLGVAAIECGRPLPAGARRVGQGEQAKGIVAMPTSVAVHGQLMGGDTRIISSDTVRHLGAGVVLGALGTYLLMKWWKR